MEIGWFVVISKNKYSEDDIIKMLEFLVDNIFVVFAGFVFQQTVGILMGTRNELHSSVRSLRTNINLFLYSLAVYIVI